MGKQAKPMLDKEQQRMKEEYGFYYGEDGTMIGGVVPFAYRPKKDEKGRYRCFWKNDD